MRRVPGPLVCAGARVLHQSSAVRAKPQHKRHTKPKQKAKTKQKISIPDFATVANLSNLMNVRYERLVSRLGEMGFENMSHNYILDNETAGLIADEFGFEVNLSNEVEGEDLVPAADDGDPKTVKSRPPIVTIMGHVDHGKTTILDYLRKSSIVSQEHGGITQHIGAFSVTTPITKKKITFLDTPGHAAFLKMRERGANVTDIVVLVVAADDSVMPQTLEAIKHIKKAKVAVIVAINKCDKASADPRRVLNDLAAHEIYTEDIGGDVPAVQVSGLTGLNMEKLEETIVTLSEVLDLRAQEQGPVEGWVVESEFSKTMGPLATVLVRRGTLKPGDFLVSGTTYAKVRSMKDEHGKTVKLAKPSTPVEIWGWKDVPNAGDDILQAKNEAQVKKVLETRVAKQTRSAQSGNIEIMNRARIEARQSAERQEQADKLRKYGLSEEELAAEPAAAEPAARDPVVVNYIVKADVSGSSEAIVESISGIGNDEVKLNILYADVGVPTETDLERAALADATIICFNIKLPKDIRSKAERKNVRLSEDNVIYHVIEHVTEDLSSKLAAQVEIVSLAEAEIQAIFNFKTKKKTGTKIAGCKITAGKIRSSSAIRVLRDGEEVYRGKIDTLKREKDAVHEVQKGHECGITIKDWDKFEQGDVIQVYEEKVIPRYL